MLISDNVYDATLWMIAWDGNQIAGFSQNRFRKEIGWIGTIAVRRPWRRKGLGIALMHHTFGEFYKRGTLIIGLGVDSANLTGATRLYERAGMYVAGEFALYEKRIEKGRSLAFSKNTPHQSVVRPEKSLVCSLLTVAGQTKGGSRFTKFPANRLAQRPFESWGRAAQEVRNGIRTNTCSVIVFTYTFVICNS
jgi:hypothetical protein